VGGGQGDDVARGMGERVSRKGDSWLSFDVLKRNCEGNTMEACDI
jgi:hypothetical protein